MHGNETPTRKRSGGDDAQSASRTEDSDPLAGEILRLVAERGYGKSVSPAEVARVFAEPRRRPMDPPDLWRRYLPAVRQQAKNLARQGRIAILRRGRPVDPHAPVKGVVRLALPPRADDDDPGDATGEGAG